jgi:hypothetical protein
VKLPDWNDDDGLMELVGIELEKLPRPPVRDETVEQWCREVELNAIEVAKAGNFRPLVTVRGWRKYGYALSAAAAPLIDQRSSVSGGSRRVVAASRDARRRHSVLPGTCLSSRASSRGTSLVGGPTWSGPKNWRPSNGASRSTL